jgi:cytidylate kinase
MPMNSRYLMSSGISFTRTTNRNQKATTTMKTDLRYLRAYLRAQEYSFENPPAVNHVKPIITISRQRGAWGKSTAQKLAEYLTSKTHDNQPWVVIDRSLAQHVMEDHHLSLEICRFLTEEQAASIRDRVEKTLGLSPAKWTAVEQMAHTMMQLAQMGHVIFVGRAANIVTAHLPLACHVRLIGSLEHRVRQVMESMHLSRADAETEVKNADYNRAHFVSSYFHAKIEDPTRYHLIINTDLVSIEKAVLLIGQLVPISDPSFAAAGKDE